MIEPGAEPGKAFEPWLKNASTEELVSSFVSYYNNKFIEMSWTGNRKMLCSDPVL
jgi:hypothetical protein